MSKSAPSTDRRAAKVYRDAAVYIEKNGHVGCYALQQVTDGLTYGGSPKLFAPYERFFKPRIQPFDGGWYGNLPEDEASNCRVLALCFLAAMVEAGDA